MHDTDRPVKITISGNKLSFEDDLTLSQAAQIIAFIDSSSAMVATHTFAPAPPKLIDAHPVAATSNPREALEVSGAKTNPEKIVAFGLHIAQEDNKDTFTIEDIRPLFRRAREATPGNLSRDLDSAIRAGWIAESDTKGEFYIVGKATQALETGFEAIRASRSNGTKPRSSGTRKPRKAAATIPDAFKDVDVISPKMDGLIDFHKVTKRTDKFLWAVMAAKSLGAVSVSNQDMVWLTDRLGDGIKANDIAGNYRQNNKAGYVNRSLQDNKIRITPQGEEYLKSLGS